MSLIQQPQQARANEQEETTIISVPDIRQRVGRAGTVRGVFRLNGKSSFSRGVHLILIDACSLVDFRTASSTLSTLTHASQQRFTFRVTVWSRNLDDARFVVGNLLQLRAIEKVDLWNGVLCGSCHCEDIDVIDDTHLIGLGMQENAVAP
ncbi:hypothetical protein PPTG_04238 [Phytophthora nicotianae INRA-310]|uniref:Uncharacterized protein n=1 Tax=Phytophthora nicotianae (strain INRA-310) TaxID=761204 RepID=W2R028_PHYN3|nr:hypothetical protein PPTG_04238 [Phytophthora nicotianae INRA-310]ETN18728.1 hypothetical protein PPTG_04238 [Phytophthora nicotianae INRA-310]